MDYRFTLNLPISSFSMKANLTKIEPSLLNFWNKIDIYNKQKKYKKNFVLNDGPPYANGDIHIGHAFNKVLKDIIIKFKILNRYYVNFIPGWDCHGLPIELNVEKNLSKVNVSNNLFRDSCKTYANSQINIQKQSFSRLGLVGDWNNFYKTMDKSYEISIITSFKNMLKKEYIYSGYKPVYWCFDCASALAEAEIEYDLKNSKSLYIFFEIYENDCLNKFISNKLFNRIGLIVWTTTPWTLPFNEAVAIKPNDIYILFEYKMSCYIVNKSIFNNLITKLNFENYNILLYIHSSILDKCILKHPFYKKQVNIIFSDHVTSDSGTGCVHIAPTHGDDDYKIAIKYKLPIKNNINEKGFFSNDVFLFSNMSLNNVDYNVVNLIRLNKNLVYIETIQHRYPYCWRHKTLLIFRTTKQWFLNLNLFKNELLNNIKNNIEWIPSIGKEKMLNMLNDRPDWCISRQRIWGVPLILFVDKFGSLHPNTISILNKSIDLIKEHGVDFWYKLDVFKIFSVNSDVFQKVTDVLDVWFDSSAAYKFLSSSYNIKLPIDLCIEGSDQYRGWFQVSLINCVSNYYITPYKTIISHGFVLDKFGRKMSKSLRNVITPSEIINKYGADIFRLWVSSVNYFFDVNISSEILNRISDVYRKIRNTLKFCLSNLYDFINYNVKNIKLLKIDKWILYEFSIFKINVINDYSSYKFFSAYQKIYYFCINNLAGKYLDLIKDRLYTSRYKTISRQSAQLVLFYLVYNLIKLIAPILSFTAEEGWLNLPIKDNNSIFLSNFNINLINFNNIQINIYENILLKKILDLKVIINKLIEEYRVNNNFGTSLEISLKIYCNFYWHNLLSNISNELYLFFSVSSIDILYKNYSKKNILPGISLDITLSSLIKCERCWQRNVNYLNTINGNIYICKKCFLNLYYNEEKRRLI